MSVDVCLLHILCYRISRVCMSMSEYVCVPAHYSLKAEPSSVLRNRELTEHCQTPGVAFTGTGFRATE